MFKVIHSSYLSLHNKLLHNTRTENSNPYYGHECAIWAGCGKDGSFLFLLALAAVAERLEMESSKASSLVFWVVDAGCQLRL